MVSRIGRSRKLPRWRCVTSQFSIIETRMHTFPREQECQHLATATYTYSNGKIQNKRTITDTIHCSHMQPRKVVLPQISLRMIYYLHSESLLLYGIIFICFFRIIYSICLANLKAKGCLTFARQLWLCYVPLLKRTCISAPPIIQTNLALGDR